MERLDADSECDALVPTDVPSPVTATVDAPQGGSGCGGGFSEGTGHVAAADAFTPRGAAVPGLHAGDGGRRAERSPVRQAHFRRDGNACTTGAIDEGWDGTVVEQASNGACGWRFWPRLLAAP